MHGMNQSLSFHHLNSFNRKANQSNPGVRVMVLLAFLVTFFLFARTAGLIHSEIHPFHCHTAQCEIYQGMAHPASGDAVFSGPKLPELVYGLLTQTITLNVLSAHPAVFLVRAPPVAAS